MGPLLYLTLLWSQKLPPHTKSEYFSGSMWPVRSCRGRRPIWGCNGTRVMLSRSESMSYEAQFLVRAHRSEPHLFCYRVMRIGKIR